MIECVVSTPYIPSNQEHLAQLFTGFQELHRRKIVHVAQKLATERGRPVDNSNPWYRERNSLLYAVLNGETVVCYDTHDSGHVHDEILQQVHFYFKRSFTPEQRQRPNGEKIHPLGLCYLIFTQSPDFARAWRGMVYERGAAAFKRVMKSTLMQEKRHLGNFYPRPQLNQTPRVLFLVRLWDPDEVSCQKLREERFELNARRVKCIRRLRHELGERFVGGLAPTPFALREFPGDIAENPAWCRDYIHFQREFPIGVATTGIHGSIGFKFAEYIAQAKAVISEPLQFQPTGDLATPKNYLEFTSPDECVEAAVRLLENRELRISMIMDNYRYYHAFLRPDTLILNSLAVALGNNTIAMPVHH